MDYQLSQLWQECFLLIPAPIVVFSPIVTPGQITEQPPIHALSLIETGDASSGPFILSAAATG
jgi:hypothetical protein